MQYYQTTSRKISGSNFNELRKKAERVFNEIKSRTKRKPYIRSAYFDKSKIFLDYFWEHFYSKNLGDRRRRIVFYIAALELIQNSHFVPQSKESPNNKNVIFHRFTGKTKDGYGFIIQIKEDKRSGQKYLIPYSQNYKEMKKASANVWCINHGAEDLFTRLL